MSGHGLPQSLLDLTYAWTRTQRPALRTALQANSVKWRSAHSQALLHPPRTQSQAHLNDTGYSRAIRRRDNRSTQIGREVKPRLGGAIGKLKRRVDALLAQPFDEYGSFEGPVYSEEDLQTIYADLLAHQNPHQNPHPPSTQPSASKSKQKSIELDHATVLRDALSRLDIGTISKSDSLEKESGGLSEVLRKRQLKERVREDGVEKQEREQDSVFPDVGDSSSRVKLISWLQDAVTNFENLGYSPDIATTSSEGRKLNAPVRLLSVDEWTALVHSCVESNDIASCETVLDLAQRNDPTAFASALDHALDMTSARGDVSATESLIGRFTNGKPSEYHRDMHIKAHLKAPPANASKATFIDNVTRALTILHNYESIALAPPQRSYTRLITSLFRAQSTFCHAQAWDLFSHMRYVAHTKPDELTYALMIRACAGAGASHSARNTEPERALDLWKELTEDGHTPSLGAYNAIILACARSKSYATEAFRLVKEMLDAHRDAFGNPIMQPDKDTFCALLEAAKKTGDLARARWILAEMINSVRKRTSSGVAEPSEPGLIDEEVMMHVFHAYSAYEPPFRRMATKVVSKPVENVEQGGVEENMEARSVEERNVKRFTAVPPQTHAEVIAEVSLLFERILTSHGRLNGACEESLDVGLSTDAFSNVSITPRLVNAYLSVHYAHNTLRNVHTSFKTVFEECGVERTERSYVELLERLATRQDGDEKAFALEFAEEVWAEWVEVEKGLLKFGLQARMIERAYAAMIKITAMYGDASHSIQLVRNFFEAYNPRSIRQPPPKPAMRSTRTQLFSQKPIVRLTSGSDVADDRVPPLLTFTDVAILHRRLVLDGRRRDIDYLKYVCVSYECGLRERRERALKYQ